MSGFATWDSLRKAFVERPGSEPPGCRRCGKEGSLDLASARPGKLAKGWAIRDITVGSMPQMKLSQYDKEARDYPLVAISALLCPDCAEVAQSEEVLARGS